MVNTKYNALYTDNLGCERAVVYLSGKGLQLNVRGYNFESEYLDFDFTAKSLNKVNEIFYMKGNELIDYLLDVKISLALNYNNKNYIKKFLLSIERHKNYYKNTLSFLSKEISCSVIGYNLEELIFKMKEELQKRWNIQCCFLSMINTNELDSNCITALG